MDRKRTFNVAIVDNCQFTQLAMSALCKNIDANAGLTVKTFNQLDDFTADGQNGSCDLIFYDVLSCAQWNIDPDQQIARIRSANPLIRVCIFSVVHEFMLVGAADWTIDKRVPLTYLQHVMMSALTAPLPKHAIRLSVICGESYQLSKWQTSVLRGYLANCHTKVIARTLNCSCRQVYTFRNDALEQVGRQRGNRGSLWRCLNRLNTA